jgi:hypothetical protein
VGHRPNEPSEVRNTSTLFHAVYTTCGRPLHHGDRAAVAGMTLRRRYSRHGLNSLMAQVKLLRLDAIHQRIAPARDLIT